ERYQKVRHGVLKIRFVSGALGRGRQRAAPMQVSEVEGLLVERGIGAAAARELAARFGEERIREKVGAFDALVKSNDKRVSKNPPGFLYKAIVDDYRFSRPEAKTPERQKGARVQAEKESPADREEHARMEKLALFLEKLTPDEVTGFEESAL